MVASTALPAATDCRELFWVVNFNADCGSFMATTDDAGRFNSMGRTTITINANNAKEIVQYKVGYAAKSG